jgi:hypothetical protein
MFTVLNNITKLYSVCEMYVHHVSCVSSTYYYAGLSHKYLSNFFPSLHCPFSLLSGKRSSQSIFHLHNVCPACIVFPTVDIQYTALRYNQVHVYFHDITSLCSNHVWSVSSNELLHTTYSFNKVLSRPRCPSPA